MQSPIAAGSYQVSAFFCAKTLTTAPVEVVQVFIFAVIVYFMTGYQARCRAQTVVPPMLSQSLKAHLCCAAGLTASRLCHITSGSHYRVLCCSWVLHHHTCELSLTNDQCKAMQATAGKFLIYYVTLVLFTLTSETVGHLCAIATKTSHTGSFLPATGRMPLPAKLLVPRK